MALFAELDPDPLLRIREISHMLKPPEIEDFGINFALKSLVTRISKGARIEGDYSFIGKDERFSTELEMSLYRSVQEALNNILKHSHATEFSVQLINKESGIKLIISDNGIGIPDEYFSTGNIKQNIFISFW